MFNSPTPARRAGLSILLLLIASAAITAVSLESMNGRFYLDSEGHFRSIPYFQEPSLSLEKIYATLFDNPYPAAQRPIPTLSFLIENAIAGLSPRSGRLINTLIHGLNLLLLFSLCRHLLLQFGQSPPLAERGALLAALLWGLNPFHADTVFYVIQRMTLLSASFYMLGVIAYLHTRTSPRSWGWWGVLMASFIAGIASKENAALLPLGLLLLEFVLPADRPGGLRARRRRLAGLACAVLILPALGAMLLGYNPAQILQGLLQDSANRVFTNTERLLTQGRVLMHYLSLLFFPHPDRLAFVLKYPLSHTLFSPITTLLSWGGIALLLIASSLRIKQHPLLWLAIFWFFTNHLLESTFIQLEMAFIHRNYLPSVFLFLPIACWLASRRAPRLAIAAPVGILMLLFLFGWHSRAVVWGDPVRFWGESVEKAPGSLRGYINLGILWDLKGEPARALAIYRQGAERAHDENRVAWASLYCNMGIAAMHLGQYGQARDHISRSLGYSAMPGCLLNLAKLYLKLNDPGMAMRALDELARGWPRYRKLHLLRARAYLAAGQRAAARAELHRELALFPRNREARALLEGLNRR